MIHARVVVDPVIVDIMNPLLIYTNTTIAIKIAVDIDVLYGISQILLFQLYFICGKRDILKTIDEIVNSISELDCMISIILGYHPVS